MFRNYLKVTLRNIRKDKWYSLINVIGLTIGITGSLLIYLHVYQELTFDNFHKDAEQIHRVVLTSNDEDGDFHRANVPYPMINVLNEDLTELEFATQYHYDDMYNIQSEGENFKVDKGIFADSNFFEILNFPTIEGDPTKSLAEPNYVFLSETTAKRIFGTENAVGRPITLENDLELEVAGIFQDVPRNSSIQFDMAVSYPTFSSKEIGGLPTDSWNFSATAIAIVKIRKSATVASVNDQIDESMKKYLREDDYAIDTYHLQNIEEIHYDSRWNYEAINITALITIGIIGTFILFLGCVNFINLSTALAIKKSKEVGVRKTLGASRSQLLIQFLGETFIVTFISGFFSIALTERLIPIFNSFFSTRLVFNFFDRPDVMFFMLGLVISVTALAGTYPAFVMSRLNPIKTLKNNVHGVSGTSLFLRKGLITFQFVISQVLIISTIVIAYQMDYFLNKPLGFEKEGVVSILVEDYPEKKLETFKSRLLALSDIQNVALGLGAPTSQFTFTSVYRLASEPEDTRINIQVKPADVDYLDTYGLELIHGRWFTTTDELLTKNSFREDSTLNQRVTYVINEKGARAIGFADPAAALGQVINTGVGGKDGEIIGIVKDFHLGSLREEIMPGVFLNYSDLYRNAGIKISLGNTQETLRYIESVFSDVFPEEIFEYNFVQEEIKSFYKKEEQAYYLFIVFSGLSIFISCLGLLGMISFIVAQRTKEVGVRKVLGASVNNILMLFTKDFMLLVLIAFIVAAPLAWYFMSQWLSEFAYKVDMSLTYFLYGIGISLITTFATIAYQSLGAAFSNPVNALRDE